MEEHFTITQIIGVASTIITLLLSVIGFFIRYMVKNMKEILRRFDLLTIEVLSSDFAQEKHYGNGYSSTKAAKKEVLMKEYNFVHKD